MARLQRALATVPVLLALSLTTAAAASSCPGRFVVGPTDRDPLLVLVGDGGQVTSLGDCTIKAQKGKRRWPLRAKLTGCAGYPSRLKLRGRWSEECDRLAIALVGKRFRRTLAATLSKCGDGFIDRTGDEQCESTFDCPPRQVCSDDCRCEKSGVRPGDDDDCLPGQLEDSLGLDRTRADSDGDGADDGAEDLDGDGLANCDELARGTALDEVDTDNDGANDYEEVLAGTNPLERQVNPLAAGEIVSGTISRAGIARRYRIELPAPSHVIVRVIDTTGNPAFWPCIDVYDALGKANGAKRCGDGFVNVARDFGAGPYEIVVSEQDHVDTGSFQLEWLPLATANAVPPGADAYIDDELPPPFGFVRLYRFTLGKPRRVILRLEARADVVDFSPCFVVLDESGNRIDGSERCGLQVDRDVELGTGTYYVLVSDKDNNAAGPYRLRVFPLDPAYARPLPLAPPAECRTLEGWGEDLDAYAITLDVPTTLKLVLTKRSGSDDFEPCLRMWNDATRAMFFPTTESCSGAIAMTWSLPAGTYYATVHDESRDAVGGYCLSHE